MSIEDEEGNAERCYRFGCPEYVTGASDFCSAECEEQQERDIEEDR